MDTYSLRYLDRYAEQLWDTLFAKAHALTLFEWSALSRPIESGDRAAWEKLPTSFNFDQMTNGDSAPTMARVAGYSLERADQFLGQLGNPIGIASYKPYQSNGEDFLHNYLGMIGIPMDLHPEFPTNANLVLLTECAKFDPDIVAKIKAQLVAGKSVVITSGLLRALQGKGIEDLVELRCTDRKFLAHEFFSGFGAGNGEALDPAGDLKILFPEIDFLTNDAWPIVRALADGSTYPVLLMDRYATGELFVWTLPDNFCDLYRLPPSVTGAIKDQVMRGFPIRLDGPGQVALFAYDNHTLIVESYLPTAADVKISLAGDFSKLKNLVTGEIVQGHQPPASWERQPRSQGAGRVTFQVRLPPHSHDVFAAEN